MAQRIDEAYWGRYKRTKAEAKVYARKVYLDVIEPKGIPTIEYKVHSFDEKTGQALLTTGLSAQIFAADFSTMRLINQDGEPVKMMESVLHRMFMAEKYKDGEPPSPVIPIILVVGVILLLVIVFNK